jgi:hypothetical protein
LILQQIAGAGAAVQHELGSAPIANQQTGVHCATGKADFPVANLAGFD